jgi:hypothetical protein
MWGRILARDKKKEELEKQATRQPEEYGLAVIGKRAVTERLNELDQVTRSEDDIKKGRQTGPMAHFASMMKLTYGLARGGFVTQEAADSMAWFYARWQGALNDSNEPLQKACEFQMTKLFTLYGSISILPEDIAKDIAVILYQGKPGQNMEGQHLLP